MTIDSNPACGGEPLDIDDAVGEITPYGLIMENAENGRVRIAPFGDQSNDPGSVRGIERGPCHVAEQKDANASQSHLSH